MPRRRQYWRRRCCSVDGGGRRDLATVAIERGGDGLVHDTQIVELARRGRGQLVPHRIVDRRRMTQARVDALLQKEVARDDGDQLRVGELGQILVDDVHRVHEPLDDAQAVHRAVVGLGLADDATVEGQERHAIAGLERAARIGGGDVDGEIDARGAGAAIAHGAADVDEQPVRDHGLAIELAHHQLAGARGRLPRDLLERIAGRVLAQLAQVAAEAAMAERLHAEALVRRAGEEALLGGRRRSAARGSTLMPTGDGK